MHYISRQKTHFIFEVTFSIDNTLKMLSCKENSCARIYSSGVLCTLHAENGQQLSSTKCTFIDIYC